MKKRILERINLNSLFYKMDNQYLTTDQKVRVESVYQMPLAAFSASLMSETFAMNSTFIEAYFNAAIASTIVWIFCRYYSDNKIIPILGDVDKVDSQIG